VTKSRLSRSNSQIDELCTSEWSADELVVINRAEPGPRFVRWTAGRTLRDAVVAAFATTGAATPRWPDPHPGAEGPLDEEYSRYRILSARAEAWVQALGGLGLAVVEAGDPGGVWRDRPRVNLDRTIWLRPVREQAVPLLVGFRPMDEVSDAVVDLGAGGPAVLVLSSPDCRCDACDDGSDRLLEEFDKHVFAVVSGALIHVETEKGTVITTGSEWSASGRFSRAEAEALLAQARAGASQHGVVRGGPWW
jgi:Family of unknown function (DUF6226)